MKLLLLAAVLALPGIARAADLAQPPAAPTVQGVWRGAIGALPVQVCLTQGRESDGFGNYYYLSQLKSIHLYRLDDGDWREDDPKIDARLTFKQDSVNQLSGTWHRGAKSLPLKLARVAIAAADDKDRPCGAREFIAPRITPFKLVAKPARRGSFAYTALHYDIGRGFDGVELDSFAFAPSKPGDPAINAALKLDPYRADGPADYLGCISSALASNGRDGSFEVGNEPFAIAPSFLTVKCSEGDDCGGAHPNNGYAWTSYDRRSGKVIALGSWFAGFAASEHNDGTGESGIPIALRKLIVTRMTFGDKECGDVVGDADYWSLGLTARGMIFSPSLPHVAQACVDDAVVPYALLRRFLSPTGKAGVARALGH